MNLGANVAFDCSNGGTVTMVGKATSLTRVGVEDGWSYYDDLYLNATADLSLDISGSHFVESSVTTRSGATVLLFGIKSRQPNGTADIGVTGLVPGEWYRLQFDGEIAQSGGGQAHARATPAGELQFNNAVIPHD